MSKNVDKSMLNKEEKALVEIGKGGGRPKGINYGVQKLVKINEAQNENWNKDTPKAIRNLLEGKFELDTEILMKMIPEFIKNKIEVDLTEKQTERVKELYAKI